MKSGEPDRKFPVHWLRRVERFLATGQKRRALAFLDKVIEDSVPLFQNDPKIQEERRIAIALRVQLLREWHWFSEALAWLCLECVVSPDNALAQATRDRLLSFYRLRESGAAPDVHLAGDISNSWPGVAGMHDLKAILERDVILPIQQPELFRRYKLDLPNGILLYGPPGCGKTHIARTLAGRLGFTFKEVKPSDIGSIWVHGTQGLIRKMFDDARGSPPCMLFLDEIDAMVPARGGDSVGHHYGTEVTEFLKQLEGCWQNRVFVIAATNRPESIDSAARRPGRLDKKVFVGPPDLEARMELFRMYLEGRPQQRIDLLACAEMTENYTCAEVKNLVEEAARSALGGRRDMELADVMQAVASNKAQHTPDDIEKYRRALD